MDSANSNNTQKYISYHSNGKIKSISWEIESSIFKINRQKHNETEPAYQEWNDKYQLIEEKWFLNGEFHNETEPAYQEWNDKGQLIEERWFLYGKYYNENGPAFREWNDQGQLIKCEYYLYGQLQPDPKWKNIKSANM